MSEATHRQIMEIVDAETAAFIRNLPNNINNMLTKAEV